jgi:hypothetical protein
LPIIRTNKKYFKEEGGVLMPNWCDTKFVFYGNKNEILEFYNRLKRILDSPNHILNEFKKSWLGNILMDYGFDWENAPCRGNVDDIADDVTVEGNEACFSLNTTSAWSPLTEMWDLILKKEYPSVKYVYLAIEPGSGIFINTDTSGKYLTEKYLLDLVLPEEMCKEDVDVDIYEFYDSPEEILEELEKRIRKKFKSLDEAREFLEKKLDEIEDIYGEYHAVIAEFTPDESEKEEIYKIANIW